MKNEQTDIEAELLAECGFWKNFTGQVRRPADLSFVRAYWILRLLTRALVLSVRFSIRAKPRRPEANAAQCDVLLVYFTENQRRSFGSWFGTDAGIQTASWMTGADWDVSWARCGFLTLRYFWPVYKLLRKRPDSALTLPWLEEFVRYRVGLVLAAELYRRAKPRIVAVSNDHSGLFRAFIRVARLSGYRIAYTQHASIGKNFPVLDFDLTLLDGVQAYLQYRESGVPNGAIVITGRSRPRIADSHRTPADKLGLGLATNWDDSLLEWLPLLWLAGSRFPGVALRCHPAETRKLAWRLLCLLCRVRMVSGRLEDFLRGTDVLVSGISGIILDAALHGVPCLLKLSSMRRSSDNMADYFGYQKFGLCTPIPTLEALPGLIIKSAGERTDFERVGAYEAGLVQDPDVEKCAALALLRAASREDRGLATELRKRYEPVMHEGVCLFMSSEYARLNDKHKWLVAKNVVQ